MDEYLQAEFLLYPPYGLMNLIRGTTPSLLDPPLIRGPFILFGTSPI
jgi:hypothetical protein